jgi:PIN domain nuclease of toxin-antitoxin system
MRRCLIDTNALLCALYAPARLSAKAAAAYQEADELYCSILTPWEIGLKLSRGGFHDLEVPQDWETGMERELGNAGIRLVPVEMKHCRMIQDLPFHHKDPFDRMLLAQALERGLEVIGSDEVFDSYGVRRIW